MNAISKEIARLLHGQYIEKDSKDRDRERRERNQEQIDKYWDNIRSKK